jgi:hypothetical protein
VASLRVILADTTGFLPVFPFFGRKSVKQRGLNDAGYMQYNVFFNACKTQVEVAKAVQQTAIY